MNIRYSKHALERLKGRAISKKEVRDAIINGQTRRVQMEGTILCEYRRGREKLIVIYLQPKRDRFIIITAYRQ